MSLKKKEFTSLPPSESESGCLHDS